MKTAKMHWNLIKEILFVWIVLVMLFPQRAGVVLAAGEENVTELTAQGEVTSDVNVRRGPSTEYDKIGTVRKGDILTVTGKTSDDWYRITYQDETGYVYGKYITVTELPAAEENGETQQPGEDQQTPAEEKEEGEQSAADLIKPVAIVVMIAVIAIMMFLTIRSMHHVDEDDEDSDEDDEDYEDSDEDDEDYEEDYDEDDEDEEDYDDEDDSDDDSDDEDDEEDDVDPDEDEEESDEDDRDDEDASKPLKQPFVLREEDYQLHIDPIYFENDPVPQPDCVTGYLKKKQEEEEAKALEQAKQEANAADLQKAMNKLQELQEEIEKIKRNQ